MGISKKGIYEAVKTAAVGIALTLGLTAIAGPVFGPPIAAALTPVFNFNSADAPAPRMAFVPALVV